MQTLHSIRAPIRLPVTSSTELDYETAYYYDAEVQAQIQDENGNVLGNGTASGTPSAVTFFDVIETVLCFRITIISSVIVAPHFLGCNGNYFDIFGFSDFWWGWYWDFGDFEFSRRTRCIFGRLIFIANIIRDLIECLPANVTCQKDTNQLLPSGLRQNLETRYLTGLIPGINNSDHVTISCHAENPVTGGSQSGVVPRFGFGKTVNARRNSLFRLAREGILATLDLCLAARELSSSGYERKLALVGRSYCRTSNQQMVPVGTLFSVPCSWAAWRSSDQRAPRRCHDSRDCQMERCVYHASWH